MLWSEPASKVFWGQRNFRQIQFANASYFEKGVYALHLESSWYRRHTILTCLYPRISTPRLLFSADLCWHRLSLLSFVPTPKFPFVWKTAKLWAGWQPRLFIIRPKWLSRLPIKLKYQNVFMGMYIYIFGLKVSPTFRTFPKIHPFWCRHPSLRCNDKMFFMGCIKLLMHANFLVAKSLRNWDGISCSHG